MRSGKTAKITSGVLHPQVWPQSQLSLAYISKEVAYDNLTLAEFAARFASILHLPSLSAEEQDARTDHFCDAYVSGYTIFMAGSSQPSCSSVVRN